MTDEEIKDLEEKYVNAMAERFFQEIKKAVFEHNAPATPAGVQTVVDADLYQHVGPMIAKEIMKKIVKDEEFVKKNEIVYKEVMSEKIPSIPVTDVDPKTLN